MTHEAAHSVLKMIKLSLPAYLLLVQTVLAQPIVSNPIHLHQVYIQRNTESGANRLIFLDLVTGDEKSVTVYGERYTIIPEGILFYAPGDNRVKIATVDGQLYDHPFIQPGPTTLRVDWVVAPDAQEVAWTLTEGVPGTMTTITRLANLDGSQARDVFVDGPRSGIRAMPVAFSADRQQLYMDYQPDSIGDYTTFRQYAGLFSVDLVTADMQFLPGEPGCFCGAGLGGGWFLRLALTPDRLSFDLHAQNLERRIAVTIPSLGLADFTQGGDILISPDGTLALYALAQIRGFGTPGQTVQTVFVLADLEALTQTVLGSAVDFLLRPVAWTEDNSAVILTSPESDGTWKIDIGSASLEQVAGVSYLGTSHGEI